LADLVSDLQNANAPVQLPNLKPARKLPSAAGGGWGIRAAIAGVLVVLGIAIGWGLYGNTPSPFNFTSDPGAKPDGVAPVVLTPPKQLQSLGGLTGLLEQMKQKFGDTQGYRVVVYPDYASLDRPDPNEDRRKLSYTYRGGWDDPSTTSKSEGDRLVDLSQFDQKAVIGILRGAPETLGMKPADITNQYLIIEPSGDPTTPDAVSISMYISSDFGSGSIVVGPDGSTKRISYPS
jgi:hypothetical protein